MSTFTKVVTGRSAVDLIERARSIEPRRADGGPFTLSLTVAGETRLLIVRDARGQAIGASDILSAEGVRAAARRLIRDHQRRITLATGTEAENRPIG